MDKIAVSQEPGLTNAQLMLTNDDLRPGEISLSRGNGHILARHCPLPFFSGDSFLDSGGDRINNYQVQSPSVKSFIVRL